MDQSVTNGFGRRPGPPRRAGRRLSARVWGGASGYASRNARSLRHLLTNELPEDVRDEEFVVSICFRASLVLNALTGGDPEMTFSARCHLHRSRAAWVGPWAFWTSACLAIDLACAALRGESEHCATAWENHCARGLLPDMAESEPAVTGLGVPALTEI